MKLEHHSKETVCKVQLNLMRMLCGLLEADISYANLNAGLIWIFRLVKGEIDMSNISHFVISISKQRLYLGFYCLRVINILTS
jgi:hypothetical protein